MSIIEIINKRHSYRGKYKSDTVPREDLITIMKAGLNAPSGCNKQTTSLIAVDDKDVLKKLHTEEWFDETERVDEWISDNEGYIYKWMYNLILEHKSEVLKLGENQV